jgi:nucleoside-diphosphate-sugar epimerase
MKALVTGGAGFIGSTLVDRLLAEDWRVDVVDDLSTGTLGNLADARSLPGHRFSFHRLDVSSPAMVELVAHRRPDIIYHLRAVVAPPPSPERGEGPRGGDVEGEGALTAGVSKVVFAGSGGTLYGPPDEVPVREGHAQHPESPYGVSKKAVVDYLHYYRAVRGLEYTALALANVYAPRQDPHGEAGVVSIFAGKLLSQERPVIYGDGSQTRLRVRRRRRRRARALGRQGRRPRDEHRYRRDVGPAAVRRHGPSPASSSPRPAAAVRSSAAPSIRLGPASTWWKPWTSPTKASPAPWSTSRANAAGLR